MLGVVWVWASARVASGAVLVATLGLATLGCASNKDEAERRLRSLEHKLVSLQNETDELRERLAQVAQQRSDAGSQPERRAAQEDLTLERPKLKVIRLEPDDARRAEHNDSATRPATVVTPVAGAEPSSSDGAPGATPAGAETFEANDDPRPTIKVRGEDVLSAASVPDPVSAPNAQP